MINIKQIGDFNFSFCPNVEYVNPIEHFFNLQFEISLNLTNKIIDITPELNNFKDDLARKVAYKVAFKNHLRDWKIEYNQILSLKFPENYFDFLLSEKRKHQNKILESFPLDSNSLHAIFYKAWLEFGFAFSNYFYQKNPKQFAEKKYPELFYLNEDDSIDVIGDTNLTDGQMKSILTQRTNVVAKFLDNGRHWHCFLYTWNAINGKEIGNMPHIHYISSAFGRNITREGVLNELKNGKYNLPTMIHINYTREISE